MPDRLANLVCRHGVTGAISLDAAFRLEAFAQRRRHTFTNRQQSISERAPALRPRATLSLPIHTTRRKSLVETRADWRMAALSIDDPQCRRILTAMDWLD